jgi:uncharacterized membrane protein
LKSSKEYRLDAMELLSGKYQKPIIIILIIMLITGIMTGIPYLTGREPVDFAGYTYMTFSHPFLVNIIQLISFVIGSAFLFAEYNLTLNITKKLDYEIEDVVLSGFRNNFWRNVGVYFLQSIFIALWTLLFIIPGLVKAYAYTMAFYLRNRHPDVAAIDIITESKEYTMGHKGRIFFLDLSYIGWYLLSALTFGILLLWVIPRHYTARTILFNEIYDEKTGKEMPETQKVDVGFDY